MLIRPFVLSVLAYALVGVLALQLSVPPSYASPVYPPAGIALAVVFIYGYRLLPAVALGSLLVNLLARLFAGSSGIELVLPLFTATGAALQAWAGVALLRRVIGPTLRLETPRGFLRFAILGGPVACLVSASIATLGFWISGTLAVADLPLTWWNWWTGDAIGVLIAVPIVFTLIGRPRETWARRRWTVAMPLAIATLLVGAAVALVARWERENIDLIFTDEATALASKVRTAFDNHLDALRATHAVLLVAPQISSRDFERATAYWPQTLPGLQALGWSVRVTAAERSGFQRSLQQRTGIDSLLVVDTAADGSRAPTPADREAVVITYVEPQDRNRAALGVNALSIDAAARAIRKAAKTSAPVATAGFRLSQESGRQTGVVVYLPVPRPAASTSDIATTLARPIHGVVFATMRVDDALQAATRGARSSLQVCLQDRSDATERTLAGATGCATATGARGRLMPVSWEFAGRSWLLSVAAGPAFEAEYRDWSAWLFAVTALITTGLLGGFLLLVSGRTERIQELVDQRTIDLQREVARRRAKEEALVEAERRFSDVFEAAPIGLAYADLAGRLERVNARFSEISGRTARELIGLRSSDISAAEDQDAHERIVHELVDLGRERVQVSKSYLRSDGSQVPVEVINSLSRDSEGAPLHIVKVVEDLTERKRREAAEASNRVKIEFLSRMSHELRTPLNAMLGFAQLLRLDQAAPLSGGQLDRVEQIERAGWHLLDMVNDVLDLSRIEAGAIHFSIEPQDLDLLVRDSVAMHARLLEDCQVALTVELADDARFVAADATRLRQVLSNLLSNAIKYNRSGGRVILRSQRGGTNHVTLHVVDTGVGMEASQIDHLFEPFNRLGRERGNTEGTGIGLVITRQLLDLMNGRIDVTSTAGAGTTFSITLPAATAPLAQLDISAAPEPAGSSDDAAQRVLYIEDNPINAELMRAMLGLLPTPVDLHVCNTGEDGLLYLGARTVDVVLLDLNLPGIGGIEVLRRLRADPRHARLPIIIASADALSDQVQAALDAGASAYLTKPIEFADLARTLQAFGPAGDANPPRQRPAESPS